MRAILPFLEAHLRDGTPVALATVVATWGSAPRPAGAVMAVAAGGRIAGSVSGGCVESAVVLEAEAVLAGAGPRSLEYGVSDDDAFAVGLACGGAIEVWLDRFEDDPATRAWRAAVRDDRSVAVVTALEAPHPGARLVVVPRDRDSMGAAEAETLAVGGFGDEPIDVAAIGAAREALARGRSEALGLGGHRFFVAAYPPRDKLVIVGAVHIAQPLAAMAREAGFHVTIVDARAAFATRERFPGADRLVVGGPEAALGRLPLDASTYVAVLTHDPKQDDPAVLAALRSPARYIGALGSRRTHARRVERLRAAGCDAAAIARIRSPIGLDIGALAPAEIAVSVLAEIVAARRSRAAARGG